MGFPLVYSTVKEECYRYDSGITQNKGTCRYEDELICPDGSRPITRKTTPPYRIAANEREIMKEIRSQGPVQAIIQVSNNYSTIRLKLRGDNVRLLISSLNCCNIPVTLLMLILFIQPIPSGIIGVMT